MNTNDYVHANERRGWVHNRKQSIIVMLCSVCKQLTSVWMERLALMVHVYSVNGVQMYSSDIRIVSFGFMYMPYNRPNYKKVFERNFIFRRNNFWNSVLNFAMGYFGVILGSFLGYVCLFWSSFNSTMYVFLSHPLCHCFTFLLRL